MKTQNTQMEFNFPTYPKPTMNVYKKAADTLAENSRANAVIAKQYKSTLLELAKSRGVGIVHIFNEIRPLGGLTIAFAPVTNYPNCTMVDIAVNTCSRNDSFSRSVGTVGALEKFFAGELIQLPLLQVFSKDNLSWVVKHTFTTLYDNITY